MVPALAAVVAAVEEQQLQKEPDLLAPLLVEGISYEEDLEIMRELRVSIDREWDCGECTSDGMFYIYGVHICEYRVVNRRFCMLKGTKPFMSSGGGIGFRNNW